MRRADFAAAPSVAGKEIIHGLPEALAAELLDEGDGVPMLFGGIAVPLSRVPDAEAVHFRCGVVAADPLHGVAQRGQQTWKVCIPDKIHLGICETPCCALICVLTSFLAESKNSPARHSETECPAGLLLLS